MLTRLLAAPALLAAVALIATPAAAVELPVVHHTPTEVTSQYGPYVGGGWGWGGHRGRHHRRGSTGGDILTGVLILGTIAAVASAAKRNDRRPYPERTVDYRPNGLENAADLCVREIERDARTREVSRVERSASGWEVQGTLADGGGFACSIGNDGRIESAGVTGSAATLRSDVGVVDRQYDDDTYRAARATNPSDPQPAYPGGPLPGEGSGEDSPEG